MQTKKNKKKKEKKIEGKVLQHEIMKEIKNGKFHLKDKIFYTRNTKQVWDSWDEAMTDSERKEHADNLNDFYSRFDNVDYSTEWNIELERMRANVNVIQLPIIDSESVKMQFKNINPKKAAGPDNISGKLLKT